MPNTALDASIQTVAGTSFAGGFYVDRFRLDNEIYGLVLAPKAEGRSQGIWLPEYTDVPGARSFNDGLANTWAMAEAGSELAKWARGLTTSGFFDWYLPSRDELELIYRYLKPTTEENYTWRNGENPSAVPPTHAYTATEPGQTKAPLMFCEGGSEALAPEWYWSSTQCSANHAWSQDFADGNQSYGVKVNELQALAVRRFLISSVL